MIDVRGVAILALDPAHSRIIAIVDSVPIPIRIGIVIAIEL